MSVIIPFTSFNNVIKKLLSDVCIIKPPSTIYNEDPKLVICYEVDKTNQVIYAPIGIWKNIYEHFPIISHEKNKSFICKKIPFTIETDPKHYRDQDIVFKQAIKILDKYNSVFLALPTGYGKTSVGNLIACHYGEKTAILSHIDIVNDQWEEEFSNNCEGLKIQKVKGNKPLDPEADIYIIGVKKASLMKREQLSHIKLVIFDEAHISTITAFTDSLLKFSPKYLIGLSATPKRADGMHKLLDVYFGPDSLDKEKTRWITRTETKSFTVYKVETPFVPEVDYTIVGGKSVMDWCKVVNSIAYNVERHKLAVDFCIEKLNCKEKENYIMILSNRIEECESVNALLLEQNIHSSLLVGKTKKWDGGCRVLVAGMKKAGVGFNDPRLTVLILLSDSKQVAQFEGRIRTVDNEIYDFVDDLRTLENHWKIREKWYEERGAAIKIINLRR